MHHPPSTPFFALPLLALVLAGCGSDPGGSNTLVAPAAEPQNAAPRATSQPAASGVTRLDIRSANAAPVDVAPPPQNPGGPGAGTPIAPPARPAPTPIAPPAPTPPVSDACANGPLSAPIPGCRPTPPPASGDIYQDCVNRINQYRRECQCLPPLGRWREAEGCADSHARYDSERRRPHGGFSDRICPNGGFAQNECPGWGADPRRIITGCLQSMWDEGPGEPFQEHGHYLSMSSTRHTQVACGFYTTPEGSVWSVQNFR